MIFNLNEMHSFRWGEISYIDFDISNSFSALLKLNTNQEKSLSESKKELEDKISSIKENNADEDFIQSYIHHYTYDDEIMIDEIQRIQRYSLLMSIFAFYEARLKSLCDIIEKEFQFNIKINDLNNHKGDLVKYWTYLIKVYELNGDNLQDFFTPLIHQKKIRNIIVHSDGTVDDKQIKGIPKTVGISFRKSGDLNILQVDENLYVTFLLESIRLFFEALLKEIDKRYIQLKAN